MKRTPFEWEANMARITREIRIGGGRSFRMVIDDRFSDDFARGLLQGDFWIRDEWRLLQAWLPKNGGRFLDLGGHLGTFALTAAAHGHEVIVVEGSPTNAALIRASAEANGFANLKVVQAAAYHQRKTLRFVENGPFGFLIEHDANGVVEVPALPVADILAEHGWDRVDAIKMDIEGSEVWAVEGMRELLSRSDAPPIFYESNGRTLHDFGRSSCQQLWGLLESCGYSHYLYRDHRTPLQPFTSSDPQPEVAVNCLAVKTACNWLADGPGWRLRVRNRLRRCLGRKPICGWLKDRPVGSAATLSEWIARFRHEIAAATEPYMHEHLQRELAIASEEIRKDPVIQRYLNWQSQLAIAA
jgi:FkbM family methyltransferase